MITFNVCFSARSFPDLMYTPLVEKEHGVLEERKKLYRKRIVFEANTDLPGLIDSLNTFGKVILKEMKDVNNDYSNGIYNKTNVRNDTESNDKQTQKYDVDNIENIEGKYKTVEGKESDIFKETDPFDVLRSLREVELKDDFISSKRNLFEKVPIDSNKSHISNSKHVTFLDDVSDRDMRNSHVAEPTLKQRSRMMTDSDKMRRSRSASPRRTHLYSNTKREKLQGILKHNTKIDNGNIYYQHLTDATRCSNVPGVTKETDNEHNYDQLCKKSVNAMSNTTYNTKKSYPDEYVESFVRHGEEKKDERTSYTIDNSRILDNSINSSYKYSEKENSKQIMRLMISGNHERLCTLENAIEEVNNTRDDIPIDSPLTDTDKYHERHVSKIDPKSRPRKDYMKLTNSRVRLPSVDEMLYDK